MKKDVRNKLRVTNEKIDEFEHLTRRKMFIEHDELDSPNTYAIVDGSMKERNTTWRGDFSIYTFNAYWIVRKGKTKGSLAYGELTVDFNNDYAKELNNRHDYKNLSVDDALGFAEDLPEREIELYQRVRLKSVRIHASAIFGNGNVWTSGVKDEVFKELVDAWFNLPQLPEGTSKRMKLIKV